MVAQCSTPEREASSERHASRGLVHKRHAFARDALEIMVAWSTLLEEAVGVGALVGGHSSSSGESVTVLSNPLGLVLLVIRVGVFEVGIAWQVVVLLVSGFGVVLLGVIGVEKLGLLVIRLQEDGIFKVGSDVHGGLVVLNAVVAMGARSVGATIGMAPERNTLVLVLLGLARLLFFGSDSGLVVVLMVVVRLEVGQLVIVWVVVGAVALAAVIMNLTLVRVNGVFIFVSNLV